jgi:hypothetical protein
MRCVESHSFNFSMKNLGSLFSKKKTAMKTITEAPLESNVIPK